MVFEESVRWKRKNGQREGPYCPHCYEDKTKELHLTPGATRGTYRCGVCQNSFTTNEYDPRPIRRSGVRRKKSEGDEPRELLSYAGVSGEGWFLLTALGDQWYFQVVSIVNSQVDIPTVANNVRARIEYRHADSELFVVEDALWLAVPHQVEFTTRVQIGSGKAALLCLMAQQPDSAPFTVIADVSQRSRNKTLRAGRWNVRVSVSSDNCQALAGTGGFTIFEDHRVAYDQPAFRFERPR